ncbi:hypothetical protein WJX84_006918 [Apatococcus fuscideae]|uniref:RRM domain-containing protein n=1 Tax=Apatococcus fuscideae TaxID=2026836 RepID=A0AAW1ST75_9CHLO
MASPREPGPTLLSSERAPAGASELPPLLRLSAMNWSAYGASQGSGEEHSLFVGDLAGEVTDIVLQESFRAYYSSVRSAKVITDPVNGRSKSYGFVRFSNEEQRNRALKEMGGMLISGKPIRVSLATAKKGPAAGGALAMAPIPGMSPVAGLAGMGLGQSSDMDPTNTTLFIGGLTDPSVTEDLLRAIFSPYGPIIYTKIPAGKGCGFVQFVHRTSAEHAMNSMNQQPIGSSIARISWGRSASKPGPATPYGPQGGTGSGYPSYSGYPGYGAGDPTQAYGGYGADPYSAYAAFGGYDAALQAYGAAGSAAHSSNPVSAALLPSNGTALGVPVSGTSQSPFVYDPLAQINVEDLNKAFLERQRASLLGSMYNLR